MPNGYMQNAVAGGEKISLSISSQEDYELKRAMLAADVASIEVQLAGSHGSVDMDDREHAEWHSRAAHAKKIKSAQIAILKRNYLRWRRLRENEGEASEPDRLLLLAMNQILTWAKEYLNWNVTEQEQALIDRIRTYLSAQGCIDKSK